MIKGMKNDEMAQHRFSLLRMDKDYDDDDDDDEEEEEEEEDDDDKILTHWTQAHGTVI